MPRFNIGAFFLPPIWGPAHGIWVTILYYPAWLFLDNMLYTCYADPTPLHVVLAVSILVVYIAVTVAFSLFSQPYALRRVLAMGKTKQQYIRSQRKWAVACVLVGIVMIAFASYYNVFLRAEVRGY